MYYLVYSPLTNKCLHRDGQRWTALDSRERMVLSFERAEKLAGEGGWLIAADHGPNPAMYADMRPLPARLAKPAGPPPVHASGWSAEGRTLCGIAEEGDALESDTPPPPVIAKPGDRVTCPDCHEAIRHCRRFVSRVTYYVEPLTI